MTVYGSAHGQQLARKQLAATFTGTSAVAGLSLMPVTGNATDGTPWTVACPVGVPFQVKFQGILRMENAATPAQSHGGIATAGSAELFHVQMDRWAPFFIPQIGNQVMEGWVEFSADYDALAAPVTKQFYVGAHDNVAPPAFFTARQIQVIILGGHAAARLQVVTL